MILQRNPGGPRTSLGGHSVDEACVDLVREVVGLWRELQSQRQRARLDDVAVRRVVAPTVTVQLEVVEHADLAARRLLGLVVEVERGSDPDEHARQRGDETENTQEAHRTPWTMGDDPACCSDRK